MAKTKGQKILIGGVGVDAEDIRFRQRLEEEGRAEVAVALCRQALTATVPDQTPLYRRCEEVAATVSAVVRVAFVVRALARVAFLGAGDPRFGPAIRRAIRSGTQACLQRLEGSPDEMRQEAIDLIQQVRVALDVQPPDPIVLSGLGQTALAAATLLQAVARPREAPVGPFCSFMTRDVTAAVWASSPEAVRSHGLLCVVQALHHDLAKCSLLGQTEAPLDPGETGPFGPLWQADVPLLVRLQEAAALGGYLRELTAGSGRSILHPMPRVDQRAEQQKRPEEEGGEDQTSEAVPLSALDLSPEQGVEFLKLFGQDITSAHAALARRFQQLICAVAGKSFDSVEENKRLARLIQDTANRLEIRLGCPDCHNHGTLQYEAGSFRMNHRTTTHSLGAGLPALVLSFPADE